MQALSRRIFRLDDRPDGSRRLERILPPRHDLPAVPLHRGHLVPLLARQTARKRDERTKHLPESHPPRPDPRGAGIRLQRTVQARLRHAAPAERAGPDRSGVDVRGAAVRQFQRAHARRHRRRDPPRLRTAAAIRRRARRRRGRAADPRRQYRGLRRPDRHALAPAGRQGIRPRRVVEHPPGHRDGHAGHVHG